MKYNAIPGDMKNASSYWPNCDATDNSRCNGNGDGILSEYLSIPYSPHYAAEDIRFWQQLSDSGIIEGSYSGHGGASAHNDSTNSPSSSVSGGYFGPRGNKMLLISEEGLGVLTPAENYQIDIKTDDGIPNAGNITAQNEPNGSFIFGAPPPVYCLNGTVEYNLDANEKNCLFYSRTYY